MYGYKVLSRDASGSTFRMMTVGGAILMRRFNWDGPAVMVNFLCLAESLSAIRYVIEPVASSG